MKPYEPQPGSYSAKALEHLQTLAPGTWVSGADLAAAVGLDGSLSPYVGAAIKNGALKSRQMRSDRRLTEYSVGDNKPIPKAHDYVPDEPLAPVPQVSRTTPTSVFDALKVGELTPSVPPVKHASVQPFRAGLFTDDTLVLERLGLRMVLQGAELAQLRRLIGSERQAT